MQSKWLLLVGVVAAVGVALALGVSANSLLIVGAVFSLPRQFLSVRPSGASVADSPGWTTAPRHLCRGASSILIRILMRRWTALHVTQLSVAS